MNNDLLCKTIFNTLKQEDSELTLLTNQGIFYAPELYIAFLLGKEIKKNDISIFGKHVEWIRETSFGNAGPSDFAFKTDKNTYVFELKLRDTFEAYCKDIDKLKKLDNDYAKYFLALVDSWDTDQDKDERIVSLESKYPELTRISILNSFATKQNRYKGKICCTVGLWTLKQ